MAFKLRLCADEKNAPQLPRSPQTFELTAVEIGCWNGVLGNLYSGFRALLSIQGYIVSSLPVCSTSSMFSSGRPIFRVEMVVFKVTVLGSCIVVGEMATPPPMSAATKELP